jgi:hypothetical protein
MSVSASSGGLSSKKGLSMDDWSNVSNTFRITRGFAELFFGLGALYLFLRKKFKTFLFFAMALCAHSALSFTLLNNAPWGGVVLSLIGFLIIALVLSHKELWALDQTGKKAYEIFKWDKFDTLVLVLLLIVWVLLRKFVLNK